ncbi:MAG: hypothetical protein U0Q18_07295 [Bryobacteraceae bacterium]
MKNSTWIVTAAAVAFSLAGPAIVRGQDSGAGAESQYCTDNGGKVIKRSPFYGTNNAPSQWLQLMGERGFCQFTSKTDGSRIHISLQTLYSTKPSLAALAYYNKPAMNPPGPGNPASYYCTQLGGTDLFGGVNAAGGGWVGKGSIDMVLEACVFPDMSIIDSWGLTYNTAGIIRGIDLTTVLRYHP